MLLAFVGLSVASVAVPDFQQRRDFERSALEAQGRVTGNTSRCTRVMIAFRTQVGEPIESSAPAFDCADYPSGEAVDVLYDPNDPTHVELADEAQSVIYGLVLVGALIVAALGLTSHAWRWTRRLTRIAQGPTALRMSGRIEAAPGRLRLMKGRSQWLSIYPTDAGMNASALTSVPLLSGLSVDDLPPDFPLLVKGALEDGILVSRYKDRIFWPKRRAR